MVITILKFLVKWLFIGSVITLIYCLIFIKYLIRPYKFQLFIGKPGSGKTSDMTKDAVKGIKRKKPVYCNVDLDVPGVRKFNARDINLEHYFDKNSIVLIDEPNLYWDNRTFKDKNRISTVEWFRLYRHNQVNIKMYTQTLDVDKKLRYLASDVYIVKKYLGTISVARRLKKQITIKESAMDAESQIVDQLDFVPIFFPGSIKITFIPRWTKYFDSFAMPSGIPIEYQTIERKPAAYGKLNKRKLLDSSDVSRQHGKESRLEGEIN